MALATTMTGPLEGNREQRMRAIFGPILKPNMIESFYQKWGEWFVLTDLVEDLRRPGLLKSSNLYYLHNLTDFIGEFEFSEGRFIALGCKSYFAYNAANDETKRGSKVLFIFFLLFFQV